MTSSVCLLDWDGTLRKGFVIFEWTQYLFRKGVILERFVKSMEDDFAKHDAGKIKYREMAERIVQTYANSLKGLRVIEVEPLSIAFAESNLDVFAFVVPLIEYLQQRKIEPIVITGSPTCVVKHFAEKIGIHRYHGLEPEVDAGVFLGTCVFNVALEESKKQLITKLGFRDVPLALGNSSSDSPLLEVARCAYYITDKPGAASKVPQLCALIKEKRLLETSPEQLLHLVEKGQVIWR